VCASFYCTCARCTRNSYYKSKLIINCNHVLSYKRVFLLLLISQNIHTYTLLQVTRILATVCGLLQYSVTYLPLISCSCCMRSTITSLSGVCSISFRYFPLPGTVTLLALVACIVCAYCMCDVCLYFRAPVRRVLKYIILLNRFD
jgi:hypothetical protein